MIIIEPGKQDDIPDKPYAKLVGNSYAIFIPPDSELVPALGLPLLKEGNGPDQLELAGQSEDGNYGEYAAIWNNKKQEE